MKGPRPGSFFGSSVYIAVAAVLVASGAFYLYVEVFAGAARR